MTAWSEEEYQVAELIAQHLWLKPLKEVGLATRLGLLTLAKRIIKTLEKHESPKR